MYAFLSSLYCAIQKSCLPDHKTAGAFSLSTETCSAYKVRIDFYHCSKKRDCALHSSFFPPTSVTRMSPILIHLYRAHKKEGKIWMNWPLQVARPHKVTKAFNVLFTEI